MYHPVVQKIINILETNDCWYETFEHELVRTSEEAAAIRTGYNLEQGAKAIIVRVKRSKQEKFFAMIVVPGSQRFDNQKVKEFFGAKDIRFALEAEIDEITDGVQVGGVPPFGNVFGLEVIVDPTLFQNEKIVFNAGDRRFSIGMKSEDYQKLAAPNVVQII